MIAHEKNELLNSFGLWFVITNVLIFLNMLVWKEMWLYIVSFILYALAFFGLVAYFSVRSLVWIAGVSGLTLLGTALIVKDEGWVIYFSIMTGVGVLLLLVRIAKNLNEKRNRVDRMFR